MPLNTNNEARTSVRAWVLLTVILVIVLAVKAPSALIALGVAIMSLLYFIGRVLGLFFGA